MERLNNKGFSLIEVLVSISVFFIIIFAVLNIKFVFLKLKRKTILIEECKEIFQSIQYVIKTSYNYEDIDNYTNKKYFIKKEDLKIYTIYKGKLDLLTSIKPKEKPYLEIKFLKGKNINIKCRYIYYGNKYIEHNFLKGKIYETRLLSN